jgi:hypothetical protein
MFHAYREDAWQDQAIGRDYDIRAQCRKYLFGSAPQVGRIAQLMMPGCALGTAPRLQLFFAAPAYRAAGYGG